MPLKISVNGEVQFITGHYLQNCIDVSVLLVNGADEEQLLNDLVEEHGEGTANNIMLIAGNIRTGEVQFLEGETTIRNVNSIQRICVFGHGVSSCAGSLR